MLHRLFCLVIVGLVVDEPTTLLLTEVTVAARVSEEGVPPVIHHA